MIRAGPLLEPITMIVSIAPPGGGRTKRVRVRLRMCRPHRWECQATGRGGTLGWTDDRQPIVGIGRTRQDAVDSWRSAVHDDAEARRRRPESPPLG